MSILKKPYTISVWDDVWNAATGKFEEQRVGIIGADNMLYQGRAIEPNLIRNVNGTKKFSFKMYKYFVDNETGKRVENPFVDWLVSERKVKLQYKGKWYDFIVKNINENSSNYLYTYQLEDALVQELSKNGFGVTLDAKLMNNMGTARELANYVLNETDWSVSSEALVEKVEDNLVYITIPAGTKVHKIIDQTNLNNGIDDSTVLTLDTQWKALAFYTSCTNKPHRFQFIYIPEGYYKEDNNGKRIPSVSTDENQIINVKDCQYYCEINTPEAKDAYVQCTSFSQFYLPNGFGIEEFDKDGINNNHDTTISIWYRGHRYGFAQDAKYIPALDRYCNIYYKNDAKYYGYIDNDYNSPTLLQNVITNTDFKGTTGWVGAYSGNTPNAKSTYGAIVESVYGRFIDSNFSSVVDELSNGIYESDNKYETYLKVTFPTNGSDDKTLLLNTGFYDNRTLIGEVDYNEEWYFEPTILASDGQKIGNPYEVFNFKLREVAFNPETGAYNLGKIWAEVSETNNRLKFNPAPLKDENGDIIESTTHADVKVPKKDFKKKEIKLVITPKAEDGQTYYIEDMQLFKLVLNDKAEIIKPGALEVEGVIKTTHRFFPASKVEEENGDIKQEVIDVEAIKYENFDNTEINYSIYVPQYNQGAQKVRSVDAKESNYFNILQSIAEKFEAWLELEIGRNSQGGIISKTVRFKNYAGKDNYASFRYGVNLKDIQRTYESKNIVTKLIVKQNSNEHAENGFCTIARADANQTGENYIYDFRYYHDRGMLDKIEYVAGLYYSENIYHEGLVEAGPDVCDDKNHGKEGHICSEYNLQNYFNRIKNLNVKIQDINDIITPKQNELIKLKAELAVQEGLRDAATEGLEEVREDFQALTGLTPETISLNDVESIKCDIPEPDSEEGINNINTGDWIKDATVNVEQDAQVLGKWWFTITLKNGEEESSVDRTFYIYPTFTFAFKKGGTYTRKLKISCIMEKNTTTANKEYDVTLIDIDSSNIQSMLTEYATYMAQYNDAKVLAGYTTEDNEEVKGSLQIGVEDKEIEIKQAQTEIEKLNEYKKELNKLFYSRYSRFIQEGTWIDEKYIDDNKYYADAQSVMYNSCYPQVAYTINVVALGALPGYEYFDFELGDKTYAIDPEFFGEKHQEAVIINELSENLDDPSRDQIKVQNFKNQFQDLFQKITATVQQTQYSSGSYEKAVALAEASAAVKSEFLQDAFNSANDTLSKAGQTSVKWGDNGITLTDSDTKNEMRLIGGAILMSVQDENGQRKWKTGLTPEGISASLVTAGTVDTGKIQIKNGKDVTFLWNNFGISAFDVDWNNGEVVGAPDTSKFVRFDKHGIYGMDISNNATVKDGMSWKPTGIDEINQNATFALTWNGLKVTGSGGTVAKIGKQDNHIIYITDNAGQPIFQVDNDGSSQIAGWTISENLLQANDGKVGLYSGETNTLPDTSSPIRFFAGATQGIDGSNHIQELPTFAVLQDGSLYASVANISGNIQNGNILINADNSKTAPSLISDDGKKSPYRIQCRGQDITRDHVYEYWIDSSFEGSVDFQFSTQHTNVQILSIIVHNMEDNSQSDYIGLLTNEISSNQNSTIIHIYGDIYQDDVGKGDNRIIVSYQTKQEVSFYVLDEGSFSATAGKIGRLQILPNGTIHYPYNSYSGSSGTLYEASIELNSQGLLAEMAANVNQGSGSLVTGDYISHRIATSSGAVGYEARLECDFNYKWGQLLLAAQKDASTNTPTVAVFTPTGLELRTIDTQNNSYTSAGSVTWAALISLAEKFDK